MDFASSFRVRKRGLMMSRSTLGRPQAITLIVVLLAGLALAQNQVPPNDPHPDLSLVGEWAGHQEGILVDNGVGVGGFYCDPALQISFGPGGLEGRYSSTCRNEPNGPTSAQYIVYFEATLQLVHSGRKLTGTSRTARVRVAYPYQNDQGEWRDVDDAKLSCDVFANEMSEFMIYNQHREGANLKKQ